MTWVLQEVGAFSPYGEARKSRALAPEETTSVLLGAITDNHLQWKLRPFPHFSPQRPAATLPSCPRPSNISPPIISAIGSPSPNLPASPGSSSTLSFSSTPRSTRPISSSSISPISPSTKPAMRSSAPSATPSPFSAALSPNSSLPSPVFLISSRNAKPPASPSAPSGSSKISSISARTWPTPALFPSPSSAPALTIGKSSSPNGTSSSTTSKSATPPASSAGSACSPPSPGSRIVHFTPSANPIEAHARGQTLSPISATTPNV